MNPYETPKVTTDRGKHRKRRWLGLAIASFLAALIVCMPGFALLYAMRPVQAEARYATYDPEFSMVGIEVSPETFVAVSIALGAMLLSASLAFRLLDIRQQHSNNIREFDNAAMTPSERREKSS